MLIHCAKFERKWQGGSKLKEDDVLFISDSTPIGFQWICQEITKNFHKISKKKWYRVIVPYSKSYMTPAHYRLANSDEPILGSFDCSSREYFDIEEIIYDAQKPPPSIQELQQLEWPFPHSNSILDLYGNAYCSQRHLLFPNVFTGLTEIQLFYMDNVGKPQREIALAPHSKFRVEYPICLDQVKQISCQPKCIYDPFKPKFRHFQNLPQTLNLNAELLVEYFLKKIQGKTDGYFPFTEWSEPRTFFFQNKLLVFKSLHDYLDAWFDQKLDFILEKEKELKLNEEKVENDPETDFIQKIVINSFSHKDEASNMKLLRFFDLSKKRKRMRLLDCYHYDVDLVDRLMNLPISKFGTFVFKKFSTGDDPNPTAIYMKKPRFITATDQFEQELLTFKETKQFTNLNESELDE